MIDFSKVNKMFVPEGEVQIALKGSDKIWDKPTELEYEPLEYLEFDGTLIFDTNLYGGLKTQIECKWKRTDISSKRYLYGASSVDNTATVSAYLSNSGYWRFGSSYKTFNTNNTNIHTTVHDKNGIKLDSSSYNNPYTSTSSEFTTPYTIILGGNSSPSGVVSSSFIGHIYYFKVWENDILVADWIPVSMDNINGFFDKVTNRFIHPIEQSYISDIDQNEPDEGIY